MKTKKAGKAKAKAADAAPRATRSARIFEDLHHRMDILAAKDRRKLQDLVNEAVEAYLESRGA